MTAAAPCRSPSTAFTRTMSGSCSTSWASRSARITTAPGRCTARSACRRAPGRRSTCTTRTTRSTRWPTACARRSDSSRPRDEHLRDEHLCDAERRAGTPRPGQRVGGGVMEVESMYREIILDHYRHPHNKGLREPYDAQVHHVNPLCGDEVTLRVALKDAGGEPAVADGSYHAVGRSITQANASVMTEAVIGKTVRDAMDISGAFLELMQSRGEAMADEDVLGDAVAFDGVSKYPARIKCALLGWMPWEDATARALDGTGHAPDGEIIAD